MFRDICPGNRRHRLDKLEEQNKTRQECSACHNGCSMGYNADNMSQQKEGADGNEEKFHKTHLWTHDGDLDLLDSVYLGYHVSIAKNIDNGFYDWAVDKGTVEIDR
eukprot:3831311-Heterocapsa_arctica.AAC.1